MLPGVSFPFHSVELPMDSQARREERQWCRVRHGDVPEGQASAFDCKKGASEAMGRFFVSGKYLVGLKIPGGFEKPVTCGSRKK